MLSNKNLKSIVKYLVPIAFLGWAIYSTMLILETHNARLLVLYHVYMIYVVAVSIVCRENILQPLGVSMLLGFLAFGNNIPLFSRGLIGNVPAIDPNILADTMSVFLIAQFAFAIGALVHFRRFSVAKYVLNSKFKPVDVGVLTIICLITFVGLAGAFRIHFNIGAAKAASTIPYSGYFHYGLLDGLLLVCLWYLGRTLKSNFIVTLFAFIPVMGIVLTQALLGWRGMLFRVVICVITVFWFQKQLYRNERIRSFGWLVVIAVAGFSAIGLGQSRRADVGGGSASFASSASEFIQKVQMRAQGTTRLAAVIYHFGGLNATNDWRIVGMLARGETSSDYVDTVIYGIDRRRQHAVGCSGPGSIYVCAGSIGVAVCFLLWGMFYNDVYRQIGFQQKQENNILAVAYYATLIDILLYTYAENFNIGVMKKIIAVTCILFFCKIFLFSSRKLKEPQGASRQVPDGLLYPSSHE